MSWKNILTIGKSYTKLFTGFLQTNLKNETNGASWSTPKITSFASSLSTKGNAFLFETKSELIDNNIGSWSSKSVLCKKIEINNHDLQNSPYTYNNLTKDIYGNIVARIRFSANDDRYNPGSGATYRFGFNIYMNGSLYATLKTEKLYSGTNPNVLEKDNIYEFIETSDRYTDENGYYFYVTEYIIMVNILKLGENTTSIKISTENNYVHTFNALSGLTYNIKLENLKFYDIQETTDRQAQCLAIAVETLE